MDNQLSPSQTTTSEKEAIRKEIEAGMRLEGKLKSGSSWFIWIALLSIINSIIVLADGSWTFIFGLGLTQLCDGIVLGVSGEFPQYAIIAKVVGFALVLVISAVFAIFANQARKRKRWAFIVGMTLYALDGLMLLAFRDFLGVLFHVWALWGLYNGLKACRQLDAFEADLQAGAGAIEVADPGRE